MPMRRAPRQLLTGWVVHPRPSECQRWHPALHPALRRSAPRRQTLRSPTLQRPTNPLQNSTPLYYLLPATGTFPLPTWRNKRRRPRRPVRFQRQPRQRSSSEALSYAMHRAWQLKKN